MPNETTATATPDVVAGAREILSTFDVEGWRIPAAFTLPPTHGPEPLPAAILLIPGSLFSDVNGDYPTWNVYPHVYAHLARQLSARGHAVYRFAKLGPGTGSVMVDEERAKAIRTWGGRAVIANAALGAMDGALRAAGVRAQRVVVAGHSEGAVVASMLATAPDTPARLDGVVLLAGPSVGILEIMREQGPKMAPREQQDEVRANIDAAIAHIRRGERLPPDLAQRYGVQGLAAMDDNGLRYMRESDATDPSELAARIAAPVLIVQSGRDGNCPPHHGERLRDARAGKPTRYAYFDELQHMFKALPPGLSPMEAFGLTGETDPRVAGAIDAWVRALGERGSRGASERGVD